MTIYPTEIKINDTTIPSWVAYKVSYFPPCEPDEDVGYFQNETSAESARHNFIERKGLKEKGICCQNSKYITIEQIIIQP